MAALELINTEFTRLILEFCLLNIYKKDESVFN